MFPPRHTDTPVVDERTFRIVLREPYPLTLDWLAKASTNVCNVMREREANTDPPAADHRGGRFRPVHHEPRRDAPGRALCL